MMETTYGHHVTSLDDEFVRSSQAALDATVESGSPGSMLVDFVPIREGEIISDHLNISLTQGL